jgi:hypothetical protein
MLSYWNRLISNENKLSSKLYKLMYKLHMNGTTNFKNCKSTEIGWILICLYITTNNARLAWSINFDLAFTKDPL